MSKKKKNEEQTNELNKPLVYNDHKPVTRRQFLAQGFLGTASTILLPSVFGMMASPMARAVNLSCSTEQVNVNQPAFLCFDLAGGASIAGSNVIVGKQGGQMDFLNSYETLGLPMSMHPQNAGQVNTELGLAFHSDSGFLRGIMSVTSPETRANVDGAVFCAASGDDTSNNPHNPSFWIAKAGATGPLSNLLGTRDSENGGRSRSPASSIDPAMSPVKVARPEEAAALAKTGLLGSMFGNDKVKAIYEAASNMSNHQLDKFNNMTLPEQIKNLVGCGFLNSKDRVGVYSPDSLDPRMDQMIAQTFDNLNNGDQRKVASVAKLVLDGAAGAATIEKGGYDYHNGSRATGEQRDFDAGQLIGRSLELARLKNRDLMVYVFTDGAVYADGQVDNSNDGRGKFAWRGDSSQRSAAFILVYKRDGRPEIRNNNRQIGWYKDASGAGRNNGEALDNRATRISNNVENLAKAVVANYLALQGREGELAQIVGTDPFGNTLDQYLAFNKLR